MKIIDTRDLYFAAALVSYGATVVGVNRDNPRAVVFTFDLNALQPVTVRTPSGTFQAVIDNPERLQLLHRSRALWYPPNYPDGLRSMKALIYAGRG